MDGVAHASTGLRELDEVFDGLRPGDNVVWRVDAVADYREFVSPFVDAALAAGKPVVYFRFAPHEPLLEKRPGVTVHRLDAHWGFESFTIRLHTLIGEAGPGVYYVFDCLSDLLTAWATDAMLGNFFAITCPYLYELDTVTYFALQRGRHSHATVARIRATTQLLLDLHNREGTIYLHPLKVWQRSSPTMFLPHRREGDRLVPLTTSHEATDLCAALARESLESAERQLDYWELLFLRATQLVRGAGNAAEQEEMVEKLCGVMIAREEKILALARSHFSLADLLRIKARLIGTGFIGGKAVGMLLARAILLQDGSHPWPELLEPHDSFYVGSDLYYDYLVHNGCWKLFMEQRSHEGYFRAAPHLRERILQGDFPAGVREEFRKMLEYFGQYPIIVRSSSLLEDSFGNAFAGKYDSFFCVNQGSPEERLAQFEEAVRRIFASTMSEEALFYRRQRGLDRADEQMALLVQRVSGSYHSHYFFPDLAGVGVSYNTYVWNREMDPKAGMVRLVAGLGTRAVDRVEGDYPRIVALDRPLLVPHGGEAAARRFSQRDVDVLNVSENALQTVPLRRLVAERVPLPLELIAVRDRSAAARAAERGLAGEEGWLLTFERLLAATGFPASMAAMLKTLEGAYRYPVDLEFTLNVTPAGGLRLNVVQCRPLQTRGVQKKRVEIPRELPAERILFRTTGNFMGGSMVRPLERVITVVPEPYTQLTLGDKYAVARLVGRLNRQLAEGNIPALLLGPGRWGTTTPSLGVPVSFAEIATVAVLGEVAFSAGGLMPELSFGSHFFQDLVETGVFYVALFPERAGCVLNTALLDLLPNRLAELVPDEAQFSGVVRVHDFLPGGLQLMADIVSQQVVCFLP